ncbi:MAG: 50S ribosomal protein L20 [bacterium]|nr:50S ribosomal protein L20 [bacterium]
MPRVKRGTIHTARRRSLLKKTKGFMWGRKSSVRQATTATLKAGQHAYADRKKKKRVMRGLWNIRINAAARTSGTTYSKLIADLKRRNIALDRKVLAELAAEHPETFAKIVQG